MPRRASRRPELVALTRERGHDARERAEHARRAFAQLIKHIPRQCADFPQGPFTRAQAEEQRLLYPAEPSPEAHSVPAAAPICARGHSLCV